MTIDTTKRNEPIKGIDTSVRGIFEIYKDFDNYRDSTYMNIARPAVFWPDGKSIGYGMAAHMCGAAGSFYAKFKYWGFDDLQDFYCLPIEKRNEFLENAKRIWQETFKVKPEEYWRMVLRLDREQQEEESLFLKKVVEEFRVKLQVEVQRIKNECYKSRRLRWRIRNEKARFKAEDKMRAHCCGLFSSFWEPFFFASFEIQEKLKRIVGFRERLRIG